MFDLSKKSDYGLQFLGYLAKNYGQKPVSLRQVAKEKKLPLKFLEQIVVPLKEAGLVKSKEGRSGGYLLAKKPNQTTIAQVIEVLEGPVPLGSCMGCPQAGSCGQKQVWGEVGDQVQKAMADKTLEDLK